MGKINLAFRLEEDDRFVVLARPWSEGSSALAAVATETTYDHEDLFLKLVIYADFDDELTRQLVVAVILSVAKSAQAGAWVAAEISADQNEVLGLNLPPEPPSLRPFPPVTRFTSSANAGAVSAFSFQSSAEHFQDALTNAPTPFATFTGPEHIVTSINPPLVRTLRRSARD